MSHPTRKEFMAELKQWSETAQKQFNEYAITITRLTDCVYADVHMKRLYQHRNTKVVADTILKLLQGGEAYNRVITTCQEKSFAAFRAGNKELGEIWWDWSHNGVLNSAENTNE